MGAFPFLLEFDGKADWILIELQGTLEPSNKNSTPAHLALEKSPLPTLRLRIGSQLLLGEECLLDKPIILVQVSGPSSIVEMPQTVFPCYACSPRIQVQVAV